MDGVENRVRVFQTFELEDDQPYIEAPAIAVDIQQSYHANLVDIHAFDNQWTEKAQWKKRILDEVPFIQQVGDILEQGRSFINTIYTYRSCSRALPQLAAGDDPRKESLYEKTFEVLEPEIEKIKQLKTFQEQAVQFLCTQVGHVAGMSKRETPSELLLHQFVLLLDMFALLDAVKSMKACLNNDFSFYKRAFAFLKKNLASDAQNDENHQIHLFLANNNSISINLKTELQKVKGFEDVIVLILDQCARHVEKQLALTADEEHTLLRVLSFGLFLADGPGDLNVFRSKKIKVQRYVALFKKTPVVPLFGDMQFTLEAMIKSSPNFDERAWGTAVDEAKLVQEYSLTSALGSIRQSHDQFIASYSLLLHEIKLEHSGKVTAVPYSVCKRVSDMMLRGLRLLSRWSGQVLRQSAWKYAHPTAAAPDQSAEYERVVRYNYSAEERMVLVEVISMIKGLSAVLMRELGVVDSLMRRCIHHEVQRFVQIVLRDIIRSASKKTRVVRMDLLDLRALASDWDGGVEPNDPALFGGKSSKHQKEAVLPPRAVPPSPTQLELIRSMVFGFISHKHVGKRGMYAEKDFGGSTKVLEEFYVRSSQYKYLLDPLRYVKQMTNMADLWYREFYLELSNRLQFPIDMSLPWILTDDIITTNNSVMTEFVFYPLDVYNDAANRALFDLKQRFLFEELEAEINLCFEQLVYKLADKTFNHYKRIASAAMLDGNYKTLYESYAAHMNRAEKSSKFESLQVAPARWMAILEQRHLQLMGRSVDLNHLLAQRLNKNIRRNIDYAISRYEGNPLTFIVELEHHLQTIRLTRELLSDHFELDPFEHAFHEANESTSLVSFHGRIVLHTIYELGFDFLPNYCFNSVTDRWVRTQLSFAEEAERSHEPRANPNFLYGSRALTIATAEAMKLYSSFFGAQHYQALVRLCGQAQLPLIVDELVTSIQLKLHNVILPYCVELMKAMPPSSKLPMFDYGTAGGYGYFKMKLTDMIQYNELRTDVFQHFRELGNALAFMKTLEEHSKVNTVMQYRVVAPFLGHTNEHQPAGSAEASANTPFLNGIESLRQSFAGGGCRAPEALDLLPNAVHRACALHAPRENNYSLFKFAMCRVADVVRTTESTWANAQPSNGLLAVDYTTEFYRLWSTMQFVSCIHDGANPFSSLSLFGHGLHWAGATFVYLLGQRARFETFDFSYHVERMEQAALQPVPADDNPENSNLRKFLESVREVRDLNNTIFSTLEMFCPRPSPPIYLLHPPETDDFSTMKAMTMTAAPMQATSAAAPRAPVTHSAPPPPTAAAPPPPPVRDDAPPPPPPVRDDAPPPPPPVRDDAPPPPPPVRDDMPPPPPPSRDDDLPPPPPPGRDDLPPPPPPGRDDMLPPPPPGRDDDDVPPPPPR